MSLDALLLAGAVVLLLAVLSARLGSRLGLPSLLLFLALGMALEPFGIRLDNAALAHSLGFAALVFILAEGGLTTRWEDIRGSLRLAALLATFGVVVSVAVVALFCHFVLGMAVPLAVLVGAITAPTDSAAVFAVLRTVPLPPHIRSVLEGESGLNDAPIVLFVGVATSWAIGELPEGGPLVIAGLVLVELIGGTLLGLLIGFAGRWVLQRLGLSASGLFVLAVMGVIVLAYGLGILVHVSGFAAVYVCSVVLGNGTLPFRNATRSFAEGIGWISQIGLFVMLGMLAVPSRFSPATIGEGLVIGVFLTFVARPLSVAACAIWFRMPWREQAFVSWAGLRGAVPIIMATVPLAAGVDHAGRTFDEVIIFVIVFTILQAPTLGWAARKLGITSGEDPLDIEVEVAPLDRIQADFMQIKVPADSRLHGVTIQELRLPRLTVVAVIIRDGNPIPVDARARIRSGDELLVVLPSRARKAVEQRFRRVGRRGRLASWLPEGR